MAVNPHRQQSSVRTPGGVRVSVHTWGAAPPQLLLVHGFGDNALVWDHFAASLDDACGSLAVDLRGHGQSDWDPSGVYALSDFVADVIHVLDTRCPAPVVLIGHSLGAQVAMYAAAARRDRIRAVVLVDTAIRPHALSAGYVRRKFCERQQVYDSAAQYVAVLHDQLPLARLDLLHVLAEGGLRGRDDGRYEERSDPSLANTDDSLDTPAMLAALKQIAQPILLVRGAGSAVLSREAARELLAEVPQSRMTAVAASGHTVMLDNPEGFRAAVTPYVRKFSSGPLCEAAAG